VTDKMPICKTAGRGKTQWGKQKKAALKETVPGEGRHGQDGGWGDLNRNRFRGGPFQEDSLRTIIDTSPSERAKKRHPELGGGGGDRAGELLEAAESIRELSTGISAEGDEIIG